MKPAVFSLSTFICVLLQATTITHALTCCQQLSEISFSSSLPVLVIRTLSGSIKDEPKVPATLCTCARTGNYNGYIGIEIRGSTSARDFSKKSYAMETRDQNGADLDTPLLGFPEDSDWVLYGPEHDKSLGLRNVLTYELAQSLTSFSPKTKFVEVFVIEDGRPLNMDHYNGLYVLTEKIKRDKHRVNVSKRSEADITGGYIFKHDNNNLDAGDRHFQLRRSGLDMIMVYPKKNVVKNEEMQYLKSFLDAFEAALFGLERGDRSYTDYIDIKSFVDYFLITEVTKNPDGYRGSTYLHKDKGGRLRMGPVWDYNEAYGLCCGYPIEGYLNDGRSNGRSGGSAISPNGWRFNICSEQERCKVDPLDGVSQWYRILWKDPNFRTLVQQRWFYLRNGAFSDASVVEIIQRARAQIGQVAWRNNARWSNTLKYYTAQPTLKEIDNIQNWTLKRLRWLDGILGLAPASVNNLSSENNTPDLIFRKTTKT